MVRQCGTGPESNTNTAYLVFLLALGSSYTQELSVPLLTLGEFNVGIHVEP